MSKLTADAAKFAKLRAQHDLGDLGNVTHHAPGGYSNQTINGTSGNDVFYGDASNDTINGGAGNDFFFAGRGHETFNGGAGEDTVIYSSSLSAVFVDLSNPANNSGGAFGDVFSGVENVIGSRFNDIITGDGGNNTLGGLDGNDTLVGGGGNDRLYGGAGNDDLNGGNPFGGSQGNDFLSGDAGNDILRGRLGGSDTMSGGTGLDDFMLNIGTDSAGFHLTVTDFRPVFHTPGQFSEGQAQQGDFMKLFFDSNMGPNIGALATFTDEVVGNDVVFHFTNGAVNGTIVFEGVAALMPAGQSFSIYAATTTVYEAV